MTACQEMSQTLFIQSKHSIYNKNQLKDFFNIIILANIKALAEALKKSNETKNLLDTERISLNGDVEVKLSEINSQKKEIIEPKKR